MRVEDLDPPREVSGAARQQLETLAAFGLHADGPVVYQSERGALYEHALAALLERGHAFACHCSRSALAASGGIHHACVAGAWRDDPAIRLRVPVQRPVTFDDGLQGPYTQDVHAQVGDFVLRRADGYWAYQLAVVVDDAAQGITDVVRGADLLDSTPRQILLQRALGLPTPRYLHLPLIVDADGNKLSKSLASLPVDARDPLPALRAAWVALGQPAAAMADALPVERWLQRALTHFDARCLPPRASMPFAALHNMADANAV